jgi:radical SAM protein with 4Fe4S-binding SPASM domain
MIKELGYVKKIIYSNYFRLRFPHKISYIVTYRCNLFCTMCNIWKHGSTPELDLGQIDKFFSRSNGFSWVGLTGGEPFLREDIADIVGIIRENCRGLMAVHFATNGTLTDKILSTVDTILMQKNSKLKLLFTLSIDGPPVLNDEIRGLTGAWQRCIATFKRLKKINSVQPRIGITISKSNLHKFEETYESLKNAYPLLTFDDLNINIFQKSPFYYKNNDMPELESETLAKTINQILSLDKDRFTINNFLRRKYLGLYKRFIKTKKSPLKCQALSSTCLIEPQGDIYPCSIYPRRVGNIQDLNYDLARVWSSPEVKELSAQCSRGVCPACWSPCDAYSAIASSLLRTGLWR